MKRITLKRSDVRKINVDDKCIETFIQYSDDSEPLKIPISPTNVIEATHDKVTIHCRAR